MGKKGKYLFNFQAFIEELREKEDKRKIVEEYEKEVLNGKKIEGEIKDQKWYKDYLSKFTPVPKYKIPEDLADDFDWDVLLQLIVGSFSSEYWLEYQDTTHSDLPELIVRVTQGEQTIKKCISELWSFQILRLFEIYCKEQMDLESLKKDEEEIEAFISERKIKIRRFKKILSPNLPKKKKNKNTTNKNKNIACLYCSLDNAKKILESGVVFASDMSYMNDKEELTFGIDVLLDAFNQIKEKTRDVTLKLFLRELTTNSNKMEILQKEFTKDPVFISCFSSYENVDKLSQWRAYGDDGHGVCLVFDFNITLGDPGSDGFWMNPVTYLCKKNNKTKEWKDILSGIEKAFKDSFKSQSTNGTVKNLDDVLDYIPSYLKREIRFWKNKDFIEEKEFRNVCLNENNKFPIKIRVGKGYLIPYIDLQMNTIDKRTSLKEIIIGPSVYDFDKAKKSFEIFLEGLSKSTGVDYDKIIKNGTIRKSSIPYFP